MSKFLMLVGVAAVAGAMYVAAASGSQQSGGVTAKQFKALKAQVATLSKKVKSTQSDLNTLAFAYIHCSLPSEVGVAQFNLGGTETHSTALDLAGATPPTYELTPFNSGDSACQSLIGLAALPHQAAGAVTQKFARP